MANAIANSSFVLSSLSISIGVCSDREPGILCDSFENSLVMRLAVCMASEHMGLQGVAWFPCL